MMADDATVGLTSKQKDSLAKLREVVADVIQPDHDDFFLRTWLVARNWDVKKAEKMLRASLQWRARVGADTILDTYEKPEVLKKYFAGGQYGFDKDGCPVWYELVGHMDMRGLLHSQPRIEFVKTYVYQAEKVRRLFKTQSEKHGRRVDQIVLLYDMQHFGIEHLWKPGITQIAELLGIVEANYPEVLKHCYVFNAPKIFPIAYNVVKPFLNDATQRKIIILGNDWKEKVKKLIPEDNLPVRFGGLVTDSNGDPNCSEYICYGGKVPEEYYRRDKDMLDLEHLLTVTIGRGSSLQLECVVKSSGSAIRWQFKTEGLDIGFGVFRKTDDTRRQKAGEMETIVPSERVNSHMVPESGLITCQKTGTYVIRFDNTYSWVNSKKLYYFMEVMEPSTELMNEKSGNTTVREN